MMPLNKLTDEGIHIPAISRLLGQLRVIRTKYGSLVVESAGQDQALSRIDYFPAIEPVNQIIAGQAVPRGNDGS
jgi:IS4 transposase